MERNHCAVTVNSQLVLMAPLQSSQVGQVKLHQAQMVKLIFNQEANHQVEVQDLKLIVEVLVNQQTLAQVIASVKSNN